MCLLEGGEVRASHVVVEISFSVYLWPGAGLNGQWSLTNQAAVCPTISQLV